MSLTLLIPQRTSESTRYPFVVEEVRAAWLGVASKDREDLVIIKTWDP